MELILIGGALALLAAMLLLWLARNRQRNEGLPTGRVIYVDTRRWGKTEKPLFDRRLGLTGRPDYLVRQGNKVIPVEVKSGRAPARPHPGHLIQLAAYCYLVERAFGARPPYGMLHYPDRTFAIDYTPGLEAELMETLAAMRACETQLPDRSHQQPARCARCGFRSVCDQVLGGAQG